MTREEASNLLHDAISITISRSDYLYFQRLKAADNEDKVPTDERLNSLRLQIASKLCEVHFNIYHKGQFVYNADELLSMSDEEFRECIIDA